MKTTITAALAAITLAAGMFAGQAQAHTQWRYPYKGAPYAVPHDHHNHARTGSKRLCRLGESTSVTGIVVAHHKPPYHDGLPRKPGPTVPRPKAKTGADLSQLQLVQLV